jgi:hypothetical protein
MIGAIRPYPASHNRFAKTTDPTWRLIMARYFVRGLKLMAIACGALCFFGQSPSCLAGEIEYKVGDWTIRWPTPLFSARMELKSDGSVTISRPCANTPTKMIAPTPVTPSVTVTKVDITEKIVDQVVYTEPFETLEGLSQTFVAEHTTEFAIAGAVTAGVEVSTKGTLGTDLLASLSAEIKGKLEASLGVTLGQRKTFSQSFTLDGQKLTKVNVIWVERYRQGTVTTSDGTKVPFSVRVGARAKFEKAK